MVDKRRVSRFCIISALKYLKNGLSGLGLHLQKLSQRLIRKFDLHEPHRLLSDLSPYDHLHRLYRLCTGHAKRNIRKCSVPEQVRNLMRSLICTTHENWDRTLKAIEELGGKPGKGTLLF